MLSQRRALRLSDLQSHADGSDFLQLEWRLQAHQSKHAVNCMRLAYWVDFLSSGMQAIGQTEFADILEETDWLPDTLQTSLSRLIASGQVINLDSATKRPKRPLHFQKSERLQLAVAHSRQ